MRSSSNERPGPGAFAAVAAIAAFFALFLFYPLVYVFNKSFIVNGRPTLEFFELLFKSPALRESIGNSLMIAAAVTLLSAALGLAFAWLLSRTDLPAKGLWSNLLLFPLILPPFVGAIGIRYVFGRFGMINILLMKAGIISEMNPIDWLGSPFWGVVILETLHLFPIMLLNISGSFALMDPSLEDAARSLGARGAALFRTVTAPLLMPGFFAGASIVFIWAMTDLGTPLLFEYRAVAPVQIFNAVQATQENALGYALVVAVLLITAAFFMLSKFVFARRRVDMPAFGRSAGRLVRLSVPGKVAFCAALAVFVLIALIPHVSVVLVSFSEKWFMSALPQEWTLDYYGKVFTHPMSYNSVKNSLALSGLAVIVTMAAGGTIAYLLARKKFKGQGILDACAMLPLAVPGVVLAFGYVQGFFGTSLDPRVNPVPLLVIGYAVRRLPLVVRALYAGFQQTGAALEEASASLGAGPAPTLRFITLPLIRANMLGAAILAFAFSMLEVSDSLILAMEEKFFPMTKAIYMLMARLGDGGMIASAMGVLGALLLAAALAAAQKLLGKKMGDLFRA
ncbi:MAG TPA: iron ABC transporter permease [bacterium]|nr:MAG: Spermidine/putrescine transport system permease protein PotB [bacterium ADurb.Bin236]HPI75518.1 iron ABC transporter permease [bacterium]